MKNLHTYARNLEVVAVSVLLKGVIHIRAFEYTGGPLFILHKSLKRLYAPPLSISWHRDNHYNSLLINASQHGDNRYNSLLVNADANHNKCALDKENSPALSDILSLNHGTKHSLPLDS